MTTYAEFRVRVERGNTNRSYRVVASGFGGEATGRFMVPYTDMELENFILRLGRTRKGTRRINSPEMALAQAFGTKLFDAVIDGEVRELYRSAQAEANDLGQGLRVSLALTGAPELLQVPWEYLYDRPNFLSISTWTPVVRYLDLAKPPRPLAIAFPVRILGMVSAPSDAEPIDVAEERRRLDAALSALVGSGVVAIDWLESATLLALTRQLRKADYHVFHYIGHGGFDAESKDGVLLFEDEHGRSERVSGAQLGDVLHDEKTLRLAVLNACEGARTSIDDPFAGVATSLIEREIPAVIGMQFEITDRAAIVFASEFYSTLADGQPVDSAISEARKSIYAMGNDIEWGTPVLFMRVQDGRLFDVKQHAGVPRPDPLVLAKGIAAQAGAARRDLGGDGVGEPEGPSAEPVDEAAQRDRLSAEAAERERLAAEAAERDRLAAEAAERDRLAAEAAERQRQAEAAERDRLAAEAAVRERQAEAAERQRQAEAAERDRQAEYDRLATARAVERERQAERDRQSADAAEREALRRRLAALEGAKSRDSRPHPDKTRRRRSAAWLVLLLPVLAVAVYLLNGNFAGAPGFTPSPVRPTITPAARGTAIPAKPNVGPILPPNIYNLARNDGLNQLSAAGFTNVTAISVCSGSVAAGFVRQVVINDGSAAGSERIVVDKAGSLRKVDLSTPLLVKIGNGKSC